MKVKCLQHCIQCKMVASLSCFPLCFLMIFFIYIWIPNLSITKCMLDCSMLHLPQSFHLYLVYFKRAKSQLAHLFYNSSPSQTTLNQIVSELFCSCVLWLLHLYASSCKQGSKVIYYLPLSSLVPGPKFLTSSNQR